ncbi:lysophospholipid acyltransferase family protein [Pseudogemmobacter faecipullorum]|uniref:Lysophospholipid acyltransferase family protein n=1 Tax=Pseudogemmobacter faecipullorum TaxID=2755041 RepID=A0ABS8CSZ6_9RHOB|nr:lysophospholipid acyltransferase family protein [Pseudogemmobacter faecipullorum]MCB5412318.1 lysophospholipid acyltransferase family protein [Pseudogemmobacter faecipullorum]
MKPIANKSSGHSRNSLETIQDWIVDRVLRAALWLMLRFPWGQRLAISAGFVSLLSHFTSWRRRIRENLALIMPELPQAEVERLVREVPASFGRTMIELYSPEEFSARIAREELKGPGVPALEAAHAQGRAVLLVTGHIGNYDAMRAALITRGYRVGGLYKPMVNRFFNDHYVSTIERIGEPLFPRNRNGMSEMLRFLRSGGMLGVVLDQHMYSGVLLNFMGQPAKTSLSVAEMALKYNALIVPTYGIRRPDLGFDLIVEAPVEAGDPLETTQKLNDSLEAQVRAHPDQWIWMHRRWRPENLPDHSAG